MGKERPPIMMIRRGTFLVPAAPIDGELIEAFPAGKALRVAVTPPRSVPQLRLYWSMLRLVADNLDSAVTTEALHNWIKMRCGIAAAIPLRNGETDYVPGSIAFDKMDQDQFQAFMDRALDLVLGQLIPGLSKPALEAEARAMLGLAA